MPLTGAMLFVTDLPRMTAFYRDAFGLAVVEATRTPTWVELTDPGRGATLSLHAVPPEIAAIVPIATPPDPREDAACKLRFAVEDVAAALARVDAAGGGVISRPWGGADVVDPEGNVVGLG